MIRFKANVLFVRVACGLAGLAPHFYPVCERLSVKSSIQKRGEAMSGLHRPQEPSSEVFDIRLNRRYLAAALTLEGAKGRAIA